MDRNKQKAFLFRLIIEYELEKNTKGNPAYIITSTNINPTKVNPYYS